MGHLLNNTYLHIFIIYTRIYTCYNITIERRNNENTGTTQTAKKERM